MTTHQRQIDSRALEIAAQAQSTAAEVDRDFRDHLKAHREEAQVRHMDRQALARQLADQHRETDASIRRVHERLDAMAGRWFAAAIGVGSILVAALGWLLANGVPWSSG